MTDDEIIAVVTAHKEGKPIQQRSIGAKKWSDSEQPKWNFCNLDYRIKKEPTYRPYNSAQEFLVAQKEHGMYIQYSYGTFRYPLKVNSKEVEWLNSDICSFEFLLNHCKWQDGTPCGVLEE